MGREHERKETGARARNRRRREGEKEEKRRTRQDSATGSREGRQLDLERGAGARREKHVPDHRFVLVAAAAARGEHSRVRRPVCKLAHEAGDLLPPRGREVHPLPGTWHTVAGRARNPEGCRPPLERERERERREEEGTKAGSRLVANTPWA